MNLQLTQVGVMFGSPEVRPRANLKFPNQEVSLQASIPILKLLSRGSEPMSNPFSDDDIKNTLTPMAEAGQGNALRNELETLPMDQLVPVLKAIETQSKVLHESNRDLPEIDLIAEFHGESEGIERLELSLIGSSRVGAKPSFNLEPLFKESLVVNTGFRQDPNLVGETEIVGRDSWADTKHRDDFFKN